MAAGRVLLPVVAKPVPEPAREAVPELVPEPELVPVPVPVLAVEPLLAVPLRGPVVEPRRVPLRVRGELPRVQLSKQERLPVRRPQEPRRASAMKQLDQGRIADGDRRNHS